MEERELHRNLYRSPENAYDPTHKCWTPLFLSQNECLQFLHHRDADWHTILLHLDGS